MAKYFTDLKRLKNEARIECFKGHGPGGQHRNKTLSCVRLVHEPSNTTVIATEFRSQFRNKALAFERLQEKLRKLNVIKKLRLPTQKPAHIKEKTMQDKKVRSRKILLRKIDSIF